MPRRTASERDLRNLLERDRVNPCIIAERGTKVRRTRYAKLLGFHKSALNRFKDVFFEYEQALEMVAAPPRHRPAGRLWLSTSIESGTLVVCNGKIAGPG